jgi:hypothetical protein
MPSDQERTFDPAFEREKWSADLQLREREVKLKENELQFKLREERRSRWANPLVLAVLAAALAAAGNATVAYVNGVAQRTLEQTRGDQQLEIERRKATAQEQIEEAKAEATRILEAIKTDDRAKAIGNLQFMLDAGLITNEVRHKAILMYLRNLKPGQGPVLPGASPSLAATRENSNMTCFLPLLTDADIEKIGTMLGDRLRSDPWNLQVEKTVHKNVSLQADGAQGNLSLKVLVQRTRTMADVQPVKTDGSVLFDIDYTPGVVSTEMTVPVGQLSRKLLDMLNAAAINAVGTASTGCNSFATWK